MDIGFKPILKVLSNGRWFTEHEIARKARMKLCAVRGYLKALRRKGLLMFVWLHGERVWKVSI